MPDLIACPRCEKRVPPVSIFCRRCGVRLAWRSEPSRTVPPALPVRRALPVRTVTPAKPGTLYSLARTALIGVAGALACLILFAAIGSQRGGVFTLPPYHLGGGGGGGGTVYLPSPAYAPGGPPMTGWPTYPGAVQPDARPGYGGYPQPGRRYTPGQPGYAPGARPTNPYASPYGGPYGGQYGGPYGGASGPGPGGAPPRGPGR